MRPLRHDNTLDKEWSLRSATDPVWLVEKNATIEKHIEETDFLHLSGSCDFFLRWGAEAINGIHNRIWAEVTANYGFKAWQTDITRD